MSEGYYETSVSQWLSPDVGKGPPEDDAWRKSSGFLHPFGATTAQAGTSGLHSMEQTAAEDEEWSTYYKSSGSCNNELHAFQDTMTAFRQRLMYSFPNVQALDADQLMLGASWLTDMEAQVVHVRSRGVLFQVFGNSDLCSAVDAALKELGQLKQVFALQQKRVAQEHRERILEINREAESNSRRMQEERRRLQQEGREYSARLHEEEMRIRREASDRSHQEFVRYIRGETVIGNIRIIN